MTTEMRDHFDRVLQALMKHGVLMLSDVNLPSISTVVTGRGVKGSWWGDPQAQTIFTVSEMLEDHPDVLFMKLINGKVTLVHRELWGRIYSIGVAREEWQLKNLSEPAKSLLTFLDKEGTIATNKSHKTGPKPGDIARELEGRMLIHSSQIHTETGAHAKILETWPSWAKRINFRVQAKSAPAARRFLEEHLQGFSSGKAIPSFSLPWNKDVK